MGKPYETELELLPVTYEWAVAFDVSTLQHALRELHSLPTLVVGSGGSLSIAHFASYLFEHWTGEVSCPCTPLELSARLKNLNRVGVLLISASGRNPDILTAVREAALAEPAVAAVICGAAKSPLSRLARRTGTISVAEFETPAGKDGFLATNSLLGFAVLLYRAFSLPPLPRKLPEFIGATDVNNFVENVTAGNVADVIRRETLIVLHGPETGAAAIDLESKLSEAALARVQVADYRNFAHGRHHWLAKRGHESAVIALATHADEMLAASTLKLIPTEIPSILAQIPGQGAEATLRAFLYVLGLTGRIGSTRGIDPGKPGVPEFGRKIYRLRPRSNRKTSQKAIAQTAIRRKAIALGEARPMEAYRERFFQPFNEQLTHLKNAQFAAVIFDYDGTLCESERRFIGPDPKIAKYLNGLLSRGIALGVATGRGQSVRRDLQVILDRAYWDSVFIGYYNGAEIGSLSDDTRPDNSEEIDDSLKPVCEVFGQDPQFQAMCSYIIRRFQITLIPKDGFSTKRLWAAAHTVVRELQLNGPRVLSSSHSVDVIAKGVSKTNLLRFLTERGVDSSEILCIGDRGCWPGNDCELLQHTFSLSVDEVSSDLTRGWNLAPAGVRGTRAALFYLASMRPVKGRIQLVFSEA